jgi:hypothetical protein
LKRYTNTKDFLPDFATLTPNPRPSQTSYRLLRGLSERMRASVILFDILLPRYPIVPVGSKTDGILFDGIGRCWLKDGIDIRFIRKFVLPRTSSIVHAIFS